MKSKRVIIIGSGGSGKTTLAKTLGELMELPVHHLDQLYWGPNYKKVSKDTFDESLLQLLETDMWLVDGNYNRTLSTRLSYCDTVVYLDYNRVTSILGVLKRFFKYKGRTRSDMGNDCPERLNLEFLKWVWNFNEINRSNYYELITKYEVKTVILKNRSQAKSLIEKYKSTKILLQCK